MDVALNLAIIVGIQAIAALGLNIITGMCGQASLGHAAFIGIGAYAGALLAKAGWPLALALPAAAVLAGGVGLAVGLLSLRVRDDFLAITTMGVGFVFVGVVRKQAWLGSEMGISAIPEPGLGLAGYAALVLALLVACVWLSLHLARSWLGFAFGVIADDEAVARVLGVDVARHKLAAFCLGTLLAGVAGALYASYTRFIVPDAFGFKLSIAALAIVAIGGIGSTWGTLAAAIALTLLPEWFRVVNDYKLVLYGGLLLLVMRLLPGGLAALARRRPARAPAAAKGA